MNILEPLIVKSMKAKGYSRITATERAEKWLAGELGVADLKNLNYIDQWTAEAIVERALLPAAKKHKHKIDIPQEVQQYMIAGPLGEQFWDALKAEWGEEFFNWFFGEKRRSTGLLSPGQTAQREYSAQEFVLVG